MIGFDGNPGSRNGRAIGPPPRPRCPQAACCKACQPVADAARRAGAGATACAMHGPRMQAARSAKSARQVAQTLRQDRLRADRTTLPGGSRWRPETAADTPRPCTAQRHFVKSV